MVPYNYLAFQVDLTNQVKQNIIPRSRIDDAVRRILRVKLMMGLFEHPYADYSLVPEVGSQVGGNLVKLKTNVKLTNVFRS